MKFNRSRYSQEIDCHDDFYQLSIFFDWLISNLIDKDRFLSTIEIIDMLGPGPLAIKLSLCMLTALHVQTKQILYM